MKTLKKYLPVLFLAALFLGGCAKDSLVQGPGQPADRSDAFEFTVKLDVPGHSAVESKAMSLSDEKYIRELDVLVFAENNGTEYFLYRTHGTDISGDGNDKSFKVYLRKSDPDVLHRVVVLANLRDEIDAAGPFRSSMTKGEMLKAITFEAADEWPVSGSGFRPIPMWGQSTGLFEVNSSAAASGFGTIRMLRSLARIDVGVNLKKESGDYMAEGMGDMFKISRVNVYNANTSGYAAPGEGVLSGSPYTRVSAATATTYINAGKLEYPLGTAGFGLIREIYVAESAKPAQPADKPLFLVVGGYYDGSTTETFYRIDLFDANQTGYVHYDVMRNYRYGVNIIEVSKPGYSQESTAASSKPANMVVEVTCEPEDVGDFVYNGQYMLGVSTRKFDLGKFSAGNELTVAADHPDGWNYALSTSATEVVHGNYYWVENLTRSGDKLTFDLASDVADTPEGRTVYLHITSGALSRVVEITQTSFEELRLDVSPVNELLFESGKAARAVQSQALTLNWSPTVADVRVDVVSMVNQMLFVTSPSPGYSGGTASVTILPAAMRDEDLADITFQHVSRVDFILTHRGRTLTKSVILRQVHPAVVTKFPNEAGYPLLGGTEKLTVSATVPWVATLVDGGDAVDGLVSPNTSIGTPGGEEFLFRMQSGWEDAGGTQKHVGHSFIKFSSPNGAFHDVTVPIDGYWGYPFRYWKNGAWAYMVAHPIEYNTKMKRDDARDHCNRMGGHGNWRLGGGQEHGAFYDAYTHSYLYRQQIGIKEGEYYMTNDGPDGAGARYYFNLTTRNEYDNWAGEKWYVRCMRTR